jgi:hypothetical protein
VSFIIKFWEGEGVEHILKNLSEVIFEAIPVSGCAHILVISRCYGNADFSATE